MASCDEQPAEPFDEYAAEYEAALGQGLAATGEDSGHFARARVQWLARCLERRGVAPRRIVDYGCGTGGSIGPLLALGTGTCVVGIDPSPGSLAVAAARHPDAPVSFLRLGGDGPGDLAPAAVPGCSPAELGVALDGDVDLVFTNGVLHHVRPDRRPAMMRGLACMLRPGGLLCVWENNLLNPGTRLVMSRIPFDRDAMPLGAARTRRLLVAAGLEPLSTHYLFIFPRVLRALRPLEPLVARLPLGGQYQVLATHEESA